MNHERRRPLISVLCVLLMVDLLLPLVNLKMVPPWLLIGIFMLATAQVALYAAWIVLGPGQLWWRIASVPLVLALSAWMLHKADPHVERPVTQMLFFEQWILVAGCLFPLRVWGYRVARQAVGRATSMPARQFSTAYLLGLLTLASFVVAVPTAIYEGGRLILDLSMWIGNVLLLLATVPPVLAVLLPRDPWPAIFPALALPGMAVIVLVVIFGGSSEVGSIVCVLGGISAGEMCLLGLLRREGYRLRKRSALDTLPADADEAGEAPAPIQSA